MHVAFMLYGCRQITEQYLRMLEHTMFNWVMWKGKKKKTIIVNGRINQTPFGYEYVFPKEYKDAVLNGLRFDENKKNYGMSKYMPIIRKCMKLKKWGKYDKKQKMPWNFTHVSIIPIGIREDGEIVGKGTEDLGWTHEAL